MIILLTAWWLHPLIAPGQPSPLSDQFGRAHEFASWRGRITVLDFAASWCAPCGRALPRLQELSDSFASSELQVWVIEVDSAEQNYRQLVARHGLRLPVLWDRDQRWIGHFDPPGLPTTLLLNAQGQVIYSHSGYSDASWLELQQAITRALQGPQPSQGSQPTLGSQPSQGGKEE